MSRLPRHLAWIACRGVVRPVRNGAVRCPRRGRMAVTVCLSCPLLMSTAVERDPRTGCASKRDR
jgi:hypothetical protein